MNPSTPIAPKEGHQTADWRKLADDLANEIVTEVPDLAPEMILNFAEKYSARLLARCAELEKLLAPFAALDVRHMISLKKAGDHPVFGLNSTQFTLEDVTRAKAALALKPEGKL